MAWGWVSLASANTDIKLFHVKPWWKPLAHNGAPIRTEETHSVMTDPLRSLRPWSPAITKSSWILLPKFSRASISPSPVTFLAQISLLSHWKYCNGLLTDLQQLLQASSNQFSKCSQSDLPKHNLITSTSPNSPPIESFMCAMECQVITTYVHSM